jgi:hypothetical protein
MSIDKIKLHLPEYQKFFEWYSYGNYSHQSIESLSKCELREALSYYLADVDDQFLDKVAYSVQYNTLFSWKSKDINLVTEARIIRRLRTIGYNTNLIPKFPEDSVELLKICSKIDIISAGKNKFYTIKPKLLECLSRIPWYFIFVCLGIVIYFDPTMAMWSLIVSYLLWVITEIPKHDYIEHRYIIPKNKFIKGLIDFLLYLLNPSMYADQKSWQQLHDQHHKNWRTEKDQLTYAIDQGIVRALISFKPFQLPTNLDNNQHSWVFANLIKIKIAIAVILLLCLGPQLFLYLIAIPAGLKLGFEGQHDWFIIRFGERNYWFLWPLTLNQAWHLQHHQTYNRAPTSWDDIFLGPRWIRYINPQYYIARSLFKINKSLR